MMASGVNGAVWRLTTAWTFPTDSCPPDRFEVVAERGSVELEIGTAIRAYGTAPVHIDIGEWDPAAPLHAELSHFVACIRSGTKPSVVTIEDAVTGLGIADAVLESLRAGKVART